MFKSSAINTDLLDSVNIKILLAKVKISKIFLYIPLKKNFLYCVAIFSILEFSEVKVKNLFVKYMVLLAIVFGLSVAGFANQKMNYSQQQSSENYYIRPGEAFITPNGIYVSVDGNLIQINTLCADECGIFVPFEEIVGRLVKCRFCQHWYDPDSKVPHRCRGNPD